MEMEEEKEEGGDGRDEELEERGEDGESGYEDSVSEGVETLTDGTGVENDTLDTGFSEGGQSTLTLPTSDTLESLAVEDSVESLTDQLLLVSLQETLDGRLEGVFQPHSDIGNIFGETFYVGHFFLGISWIEETFAEQDLRPFLFRTLLPFLPRHQHSTFLFHVFCHR